MKKKQFVILSVLLTVVMLAAACTAAPPPAAPAPSEPVAEEPAATEPAAAEPAAAVAGAGCEKAMADGDGATMMRMENIRGVRYCEVSLMCGDEGASMYNTSQLNNEADPMDTCPAELWAGVDEDAMATQFDVPGVWKNGPRGWVNDWIDLPVGPEVDFNGLKTRWFAYPNYPPGVQEMGTTAGAYKTSLIERNSQMGFVAGQPVFMLVDPEGTPWVMQAYSAEIDPSMTYEGLMTLGEKLELPEGWSYRVMVLEEDMTIQAQSDGTAPVTVDNLGNTYDKCNDETCSFIPLASEPAAAEPAAAVTGAGCEKAMTDGDGASKLRMENIRAVRYCEVSLMCGDEGASMYNTSELNNEADPMDTCPADLWENLSEEATAEELDVPGVWKNGPRGWVNDWIDLPVGPEMDFNGLKARWFAYPNYPPGVQEMGITAGAYKTSLIERNSQMGFVAGQPVFMLVDPEGTPWVMQAYSAEIDPSSTYEGLMTLGERLDLPEGWSYQVQVLPEELTIQAQSDGTAPVTVDNLGNTYDKCNDETCSFIPEITAAAATTSTDPVWPTDKEDVENPCVVCKCPEILDDANYAVESVWENIRGYHYSELFVQCEGQDIGGVFNATKLNRQAANSRDSLPEEIYQRYSDAKAAEEYGAVSVWMEPPRVWLYDKVRIEHSPSVRNFSGVDTRWVSGYATSGSGAEGETPVYQYVDVIRNGTFWFDAGQPIWVLDAPNGNTYIMQSVTDDSGGYEGLDTLGERLVNLPEGWTYRKVDSLEIPLTINGITADDGTVNYWNVVQDEFHNTYSGCVSNSAGESTCNYNP